MLLRQMGKLLAFDGRKAYIGATQTWYDKIKDKREVVAKAFSAHYQRAIAVEVKVGLTPMGNSSGAIAPPPPTATVPAPPPAKPIRNAEPDPSVDFAPDPLPPPHIESPSPPPTSPKVSAPPVNGAVPAVAPSTASPVPATSPMAEAPSGIPSPQEWQPDDAVTRSAKQLAEFFNGEVVNFDPLSEEEEEGEASAAKAKSQP